jgi:hypothetical protein
MGGEGLGSWDDGAKALEQPLDDLKQWLDERTGRRALSAWLAWRAGHWMGSPRSMRLTLPWIVEPRGFEG